MAYVALYRQWRPQRFSEVVGQDHISQTLRNAIKTNRIVHAYLFTGPRGTGKTSSAKIMSKAVNCLNPEDGEACNECTSCRLINQGNSMDIIEIDAASNRGIDEIRDLREKVKYAPVESKYKVYIIDEVHMLTTEAFNALLKTLEEPPKHVIFILATTEPYKVPVTVLSRCQRFDFRRIGYQDVIGRLKEIIQTDKLRINDRALETIAHKAEGSMRDALSLLDQCVSFADGEISEETVSLILGTVDLDVIKNMVDAILEKNLVSLLTQVNDLVDDGKDLHQFLYDLMEYLRNLLLVKLSWGNNKVPGIPDYLYGRFCEQSALFSERRLFCLIQTLGEVEPILKYSSQPRIALEIGLIKAAGQNLTEEIVLEKKPALSLDSQKKVPTGTEVTRTEIQKKVVPGFQSDDAPNIDIMTIRSNWKKVLEGVRKQKVSTYAYLVEGKPLEVKGNTLVLIYKPNFRLHMEHMGLPENKSLVEKVLLSVYKMKLSIQGCLAPSGEKNDLAEQAKELFGENVVEIK
ncbi:MAG: DNA polymerase III subunit gamma/tau [Bacillota bacterium]|jgi:DNA polymerase-3 subunit gamma/tau|nr:DNA polymerase III subunit gamma/tau [Clostridia bacterium]